MTRPTRQDYMFTSNLRITVGECLVGACRLDGPAMEWLRCSCPAQPLHMALGCGWRAFHVSGLLIRAGAPGRLSVGICRLLSEFGHMVALLRCDNLVLALAGILEKGWSCDWGRF